MLRTQLLSLAILGTLMATAGCRQPDTVPVEKPAEPVVTRLASTVHAADPKAAPQLKEGFHLVEQNAWRWTEKRFTVLLGPPEGAAEKGAVLTLRFAVPEPITTQLGELTLSANIGGTTLPPQTYSQPGEYIYSQNIPAAALAGDAVTVEFSFDKALAPSGADRRELSAIFSSAGLETR